MKEMVTLETGMAPLRPVRNLVVVVVLSVTIGGATEEEGKMRRGGELLQIAALISGVGRKMWHRILATGCQALCQLLMGKCRARQSAPEVIC
jgi:hypothetical protein